MPRPPRRAPAASTSRVSTVLYRSQRVDKIDLLFMIDNSASMGDKQKILAQAVPDLLTRLTTPRCIDVGSGAAVARNPATGQCPAGSEPEFDPVTDIHIGVISSSIGGHGSDACAPGSHYGYDSTQEDMSHLLTRGVSQPQVDTYQGKGYLQWDPEQKLEPPGMGRIEDLTVRFTDIVAGVGEQGCWYEASLEAWYRFLVDPAPYAKLVKRPCDDAHPDAQCVFPEGVDATVLTQRADFLRSDSLLAVIMLSDENDCSLLDDGQSFLALQDRDGKADWHRVRPTDECAVGPDDPECTSCWFADPSRHPECATPDFADPKRDDPANLRCWDQKRRFGVNWLQPIRRYVEGLTRKTLPDGTINPLFCTAYARVPDPGAPGKFIEDRARCATAVRDERMVFLGGIVGVPWQDLARDPADLNDGYLPAEQLAWTAEKFIDKGLPVPAGVDETTTLWNVVLGETDEATFEVIPNSRPIDPLMVESVAARSGVNPATGKPLIDRPVPPGGADANPINGFERSLPDRDDLQYACIFDLPEPVECASSAACDCHKAPENPLCWNDQQSRFGTTQLRAKAYPGTRQLAVLKGVGAQAIVASICPGNVRDADPSTPGVQIPDDSDWGYRPAIRSIVERLKDALQGACWDGALQPDDDGQVPCVVIEATKGVLDEHGQVTCPPCEGVYKPVNASARASIEGDETYQLSGYNCLCEIEQADPGTGALQACIEQKNPGPSVRGWCYVDPAQHAGVNAALVAGCDDGRKRMIRFVGDVIAPGALTYLQCRGPSLQRPAR